MINDNAREQIVLLIKEALGGARLEAICEIVGISVRTYKRWDSKDGISIDLRKIAYRLPPKNKISDEEYKEILDILTLPEYADLSPSQIVPALADRGIYIASESTMYRILHENNMQKHRGQKSKPQKIKKPDTHEASAPNMVWSWDITFLESSKVIGEYFKLYLIMDIFSRKIIAWEVWDIECGEYAADLLEKAVISEKLHGKPVVLHSDNGASMRSYTLKAKMLSLGVKSSYSRPRVSNDNPYSESLFSTFKNRVNYPDNGFKTIELAREWVLEFVYWYNNVHYHSSLKFLTPSSRHDGSWKEIISNRKNVYLNAKEEKHLRFSKDIRNWDPNETVSLNPTKEIFEQN